MSLPFNEAETLIEGKKFHLHLRFVFYLLVIYQNRKLNSSSIEINHS